jgi:hypothetical protein
MARWLLAGGSSALLMGIGLAIPVVVAQMERRHPTGFGLGLLLTAGVLGAGGLAAVTMGLWQERGPALPSGVRAAVLANLVLLGFCALELSDRLVRQEGRILYWTTFLFPLALVTFYGLVSARRWAWWLCRVGTALATLWFLAWVALIPFADVRSEGGPVPWYGRAFMIGLSLTFAGVAAGAFFSLGQPAARTYFGLRQRQESAAADHAVEESPPCASASRSACCSSASSKATRDGVT